MTVTLQIGWFLLAGLSALMTLFLFAFADSPAIGDVASRLFYPIIGLGIIVLCIGALLIRLHTQWWHFPLAYFLAILPPAILIVCYKLFAR